MIPGVTYHHFKVHIEDLGEPGRNGRQPNSKGCPTEGFASIGQPGECDCPDFYRLSIFEGFLPGVEPIDKTNVIYEVFGYINGGNLQLHPPVK